MKSKSSHSIFLNVRRINQTPGVYFTLEYLRVFIYQGFSSLCCDYLEVAPILYVQDAILNLPKEVLPYLLINEANAYLEGQVGSF